MPDGGGGGGLRDEMVYAVDIRGVAISLELAESTTALSDFLGSDLSMGKWVKLAKLLNMSL